MRNQTPCLMTAFATMGALLAGHASAGIDGTPLFPVSVQESELTGYDFEFTIHNCVEGAEITGIYFEDGWEAFFSDDLFDRNLRLDPGPQTFLEGTLSPDLDPWTSSTVSYEVPTGLTGVETGGSATIAFVNNGFGALTAEQIEDAINDAGFGIGLRLELLEVGTVFQFAEQGIHEGCLIDEGDDGDDGDDGGDGGDDGGDEPTGVPTPSAALLGLALLGLTAQRRRRTV